jgi:hypothetical protein
VVEGVVTGAAEGLAGGLLGDSNYRNFNIGEGKGQGGGLTFDYEWNKM